jgi:hypothetical protein
MKGTLLLGGLVLTLVMAAAPVLAHHGGAAYDQTKSVTFTATVVELQFSNPHVLVFFDVDGTEGEGARWSGWMTAPNKLARAGWTKRTLTPGDKITVSGTPHKTGSHSIQIRKLIGPDGKELPLSEN